MLYTLEQMGFVERAADGVTYRLGLGVLRLGFETIASMEMAEQARPVIAALCERTGYSSHLVLREGTEVVFVVKSPGRNALFHSIQVGARLPAHATVLGRVLMGHLGLPELTELYPEEPLPQFTPQTPTTRSQLLKMIEHDKAQGYGTSQGGFESGISTVVAPVTNEFNHVVAAISVTIPSQRIDPQDLPRVVQDVQHASAQLTQRVSHIDPTFQAHAQAHPAAPPQRSLNRIAA
jgi:DNA-binding IclR family transcriptional regulator